MAGWYNRGKFNILSGAADLSADTLNVMLVKSHTFDNADNVVADVSADEVTGGSYARQALASKTEAENDTNDTADFDAADVTFTAVASGQNTIDGAITLDDTLASDPLLWYHDFTAVNGNGGDITVQWHANGIARIT